jgi:dynein intermediate chain
VVSSRPMSGQRLSSGSGEHTADAISQAAAALPTVYTSASTQTLTASPLVTVYETPSESTHALPRKAEAITYEKSTQTLSDWQPRRSRGDGTDEWPDDGDAAGPQKEQEMEKIREQLRKEVEEELRATLEDTKIDGPLIDQPERYPLRTLTEDEVEAVVGSKDFLEFVDKSSKIIDRALDEKYDLLIDYAQGSGDVEDDDDGYGKGRSRRGRRLKQVAQYWDERKSKKRMISDIGFSPKVRPHFVYEKGMAVLTSSAP